MSDHIRQIEQAYPALKLASVRPLTGHGQFSDVLVVNQSSDGHPEKGLIFRFPRTAAVAASMVYEVTLLRQLQGKLPLPVPDPQYSSYESGTGQLIFMGYPMLPGQSLGRETLNAITDEAVLNRLAGQLAGFLKALHALPLHSLQGLQPEAETHQYWQQMYQAFRDNLYPYMRADAQAQVTANFEHYLNEPANFRYAPALRHGDFGAGNLLIASESMRISGIIDFSFAGPGDPAQDAGALSTCGDDFMARCIAVYPELQPMMARAAFFRTTYALQQALYGLRDQQMEDFEDGIADYR